MLAAVLWVVAAAVAAVAEQPEVTTGLGKIKGSTKESLFGRKFYAFEGVPYARPPIGKHRFKQSVPGVAWAGIWNATRIPNMCMQLPNHMTLKDFPLDVAGSEDCLYMNIYTPKLPSELPDGTLLDVIVHIHGGAFQVMSGDLWGPRHLMDRDFVYVNFNYRMGVLGFLSLEDKTCPGNNGLKDQNLALKWINKHIAAFGGNPNSITITGISAGGASVHYHMLSPLSKGYIINDFMISTLQSLCQREDWRSQGKITEQPAAATRRAGEALWLLARIASWTNCLRWVLRQRC